MKTRKVYPGEVHHVCQQTVEGVLVFYTVRDYLVFFTVFCTVARRYGIKVLSLCPMPDHIHCVIVADTEDAMAKFVQQYTHLFSREWNESRGRKGPLFKHRYMSSVKLGNKQIKTTINYSDNNPVERKMVKRAEDYRWNYLRYAQERHPYSAPFKGEQKSMQFRGVLREIRSAHKGGGYLRFKQIERWSKKLSSIEMQQIADYVINLWNVIDYEDVVSYYGNYDAFLHSLHDNTGSDYEIKEDRNSYSDAVYEECSRILLKEGLVKDLFDLPTLSIERKKELAYVLRCRTTARHRQIQKYLHLPPDK